MGLGAALHRFWCCLLLAHAGAAYQCFSDVSLGPAAHASQKGIALDDSTLRWCAGQIPEAWPNAQQPMTSIRLFKAWDALWGDAGREDSWNALAAYAAQGGAQLFLGAQITCNEAEDEQSWAWTKMLLQKLRPGQVMGLAIGNELELLQFKDATMVPPGCTRKIWEEGYLWGKFVRFVREFDALGFGAVPVTSVFTGLALAGQPFYEVPGIARVQTFMRNVTSAYGGRFAFVFNFYPYFDPNMRLNAGTTDQCDQSLRAAGCWGTNCVVPSQIRQARMKMSQLTGNADGKLWIGETGWSSPVAASLNTEMKRCPQWSSLETFKNFYQGFLAWDLDIGGGLKAPDHVFWFTMRDAINFGDDEHFGLIETCDAPKCKVRSEGYEPAGYTLQKEGHFFCGDAPLYDGWSQGPKNCADKCTLDSRCVYYSIWPMAFQDNYWCRLTATCQVTKTAEFDISTYKKTDAPAAISTTAASTTASSTTQPATTSTTGQPATSSGPSSTTTAATDPPNTTASTPTAAPASTHTATPSTTAPLTSATPTATETTARSTDQPSTTTTLTTPGAPTSTPPATSSTDAVTPTQIPSTTTPMVSLPVTTTAAPPTTSMGATSPTTLAPSSSVGVTTSLLPPSDTTTLPATTLPATTSVASETDTTTTGDTPTPTPAVTTPDAPTTGPQTTLSSTAPSSSVPVTTSLPPRDTTTVPATTLPATTSVASETDTTTTGVTPTPTPAVTTPDAPTTGPQTTVPSTSTTFLATGAPTTMQVTTRRPTSTPPHGSCSFEVEPTFPGFFWDPACAMGMLGCRADGKNIQCRFCGAGDYASVACPASSCHFPNEPFVPYYWDSSCKMGELGCWADGIHAQCRFCGRSPYTSIPCPAGQSLGGRAAACLFEEEPAVTYSWDTSCTPGMWGCMADGRNLNCRSCGKGPYANVTCARGPEACQFANEPTVPYYWEPACEPGILGCLADGIHPQCRFCAQRPFEGIPCPGSLAPPQGKCSFPEHGEPTVPYFWDESCKMGMLGCWADGMHAKCRFCGGKAYKEIPCPNGVGMGLVASAKARNHGAAEQQAEAAHGRPAAATQERDMQTHAAKDAPPSNATRDVVLSDTVRMAPNAMALTWLLAAIALPARLP